ncbi:MAG: hypothetical protein Q4G10_09300 [Bacteroidia bacterium]|nr:hypothetical protein [Bacteroidia bacterium]
MKRILYILLGLALLCSCGSRSKAPSMRTQKDAEEEFTSSLTVNDTTVVLNLTETFMSLVKADKVEEAVDMITVLSQEVVYKPSDDYYAELVDRFRGMKISSYELYKYYFTTEGNNDVCYVAESHAFGNTPTNIKVTFNPICVDGKWFLALKDGNQSSKLLPEDKQVHDMAPAPAKVRLNTRPSTTEE